MEQTLHLPDLWEHQSADIKRRTKMHFFARKISTTSKYHEYMDEQADDINMGGRGLFDELCALACTCEPDEHGKRERIIYSDGKPVPVDRIIKRLGIKRAYWEKLIPHLEAAGVVAWLGEGDVQVQDGSADAKPAPAKPAPDHFPAFWAAYPRKKSKGDAKKAWGQMKCNGRHAQIVAAVQANIKSNEQWRKDGGQFIPYPASWLRDEGWDDELGGAASVTRSAQDARTRAIMADLGGRTTTERSQ